MIGADAEVGTTGGEGAEAVGDLEEGGFVRDEIVGIEVAFGLREFGDEANELGTIDGPGGEGGRQEEKDNNQAPHDLLS